MSNDMPSTWTRCCGSMKESRTLVSALLSQGDSAVSILVGAGGGVTAATMRSLVEELIALARLQWKYEEVDAGDEYEGAKDDVNWGPEVEDEGDSSSSSLSSSWLAVAEPGEADGPEHVDPMTGLGSETSSKGVEATEKDERLDVS